MAKSELKHPNTTTPPAPCIKKSIAPACSCVTFVADLIWDSQDPGGSTFMLFKSRHSPTLLQHARLLMWPRVSFVRSARYAVKRMARLKASPHAIAVGCAAGVFASVTPLVGVQMVIAGAIALILRGSVAAAMFGTFFGNPLSWPLIWGGTYALGSAMMGNAGTAQAADFSRGPEGLWPILYPMLLGSIPIGLASAAISYGIVAKTVALVRARRTHQIDRMTSIWLEYSAPHWRLW